MIRKSNILHVYIVSPISIISAMFESLAVSYSLLLISVVSRFSWESPVMSDNSPFPRALYARCLCWKCEVSS